MTTEDLMEVVERSRAIVNWYHKTKRGNFNLGGVAEQRRKLLGYYYYLAGECGSSRKDYHMAYGTRKIAESREYIRLRGQKVGASDAAHRAKINVEDLLEQEKAAEALYSYLFSLVDATKEVLDGMKQDIAMYRDEKKEYQ